MANKTYKLELELSDGTKTDAGTFTVFDGSDVPVDSSLSGSSTNPVQNKAVKAALDGKLPKTGGQVSGDVTLYAASGNSPCLIFQRGTLTDNYNDWQIQDRGGYLYIDQRGSGSTAWQNIMYFAQAQAVFNTSVKATRFDGPATKLTTTTAGSASKPVYFANGIPVACSTEIPTDTHINSLIDAKLETGVGSDHRVSKSVTIPASAWNGNSCSVSIAEVTAESDVYVSPAPESLHLYNECMVMCTEQGNGTLIFSCEYLPNADLTVYAAIYS